jgi:hypothetical protein
MTGPNPYFDNYNNTDEQNLHDGLIQESTEIYGEAMYYLPRRPANFDPMYSEDDQDYFDKTYLSTFYIKNVDGFEGGGNFMSKFGLEIRDQITLAVSNTLFMEDVGIAEGLTRPREGDCIYFPLADRIFEVVFVNRFTMFYPFGASPSYTITCQLFEYNGEGFRTGIPAVDKVQTRLTENIFDYSLLMEDGAAIQMENGDYMVVENYDEDNSDPFDQSSEIQSIADGILDFTETDPFSEGPI